MKKVLALLMALVMFGSVAMADYAMRITETYDVNASELMTLMGVTDDATRQMVSTLVEAANAMSQELVIASNGASLTASCNGTKLYDLAVEVDNGCIYVGSSLLDQPLYISLSDLSASMPRYMMLMLVDWRGLMDELSQLDFRFERTQAALSTVTIEQSEDYSSSTVTITPDVLCNIVDAFVVDLAMTSGLNRVVSKYLYIDDVVTVLNQVSEMLKNTIRSELYGPITVAMTYSGYSGSEESITIPLRSGTFSFTEKMEYTVQSGYDYYSYSSVTTELICRYDANYGRKSWVASLTRGNGDYTVEVTTNEYGYSNTPVFVKKTGSMITGKIGDVSFTGTGSSSGAMITLMNGSQMAMITTMQTADGYTVVINNGQRNLLTLNLIRNGGTIGLSVTYDDGYSPAVKVGIEAEFQYDDTLALKLLLNDKLLVTEKLKVETIQLNGALVADKASALNIETLNNRQMNAIMETVSNKLQMVVLNLMNGAATAGTAAGTQPSYVGTWVCERYGYTMEIKADGTAVLTRVNFADTNIAIPYTLDGNALVVDLRSIGYKNTYRIEIVDNSFTFDGATFVKQAGSNDAVDAPELLGLWEGETDGIRITFDFGADGKVVMLQSNMETSFIYTYTYVDGVITFNEVNYSTKLENGSFDVYDVRFTRSGSTAE